MNEAALDRLHLYQARDFADSRSEVRLGDGEGEVTSGVFLRS